MDSASPTLEQPSAAAPAAAVSNADRRRPGRQDFTNPALVSLLRAPAAAPAQTHYPFIYILLAAAAFWGIVWGVIFGV